MRIIHLSNWTTFFLDIAAWAVIHLSISLIAARMPLSYFERPRRLFETFSFEKSGRFWQKQFKVRSWKKYLPDGTKVIGEGYDKSALEDSTALTLHRFVLETRRAEWTHWLSIPPAFLFFLWNPPWGGWGMVLYAILFNFPFIVTQRYNRPRFEKLYARKQQIENKRQMA